MATRTTAGPGSTIAFLSPTGWGNLGDAAIIASFVQATRQRVPGARLVGFTLRPWDTVRRHAVEAHSCAAFGLPFYPVEERDPDQPPALASSRRHGSARSPWGNPFATARDFLRRIPVHGPLRTWAVAPARLCREPRHLALSRERLRGASMLVVAGGGQLDAAWGGILGHPYVLWRWARIARAVGTRFVFASVGTGSLDAGSRHLVRRALTLADYRSFRDRRSRELIGSPSLTRADPIVPDLAYALPVRPHPPPARPRLLVGLSPMNFCHPTHWPERDRARYRRHVASFAAISARLAERGDEVVLFTSDSSDGTAVRDVVAALAPLPDVARRRVRIASTETLQDLMATLSELDLVVAARLHGVLLAHLAGCAVLAVSHERKVRTLMEDAGQQRYCVDIDALDADGACALLAEMALARLSLASRLSAHVAACRAAVEAQYDALLGPAAPLTSAPSSRDSAAPPPPL